MRLINAEEAIKEILDVYEYEYPTASGAFDHFVTHMIPNILNNLPSVDAEPVRNGRWIKRDIVPDYMWKYHCSCCHSDGERRYNYCPNCGAKMDKVE